MVGVIFFLTCSPVLDLGHFAQMILPIVLQIMQQPKNNPNHQVLFTASDGWCFFFFDLFSHSGLRAFFTSDFANCTTNCTGAVHKWLGFSFYAPGLRAKIIPTIRCCEEHLMVGVNFFLTCSPILDLGHFSQVILPIVLLIMPQLQVLSQHLMVGVFFFLTQVILPIVLLIMPQPSGAVHSIWWLGLFFFDLFSRSGLRAFCTNDFANCTTNYASPQK